MTINISEEKEMELQQIYSMTVEEKFQYIKDKGHIIDPHELDIFFQFENPDKPTKSELRTLDLIVGEIMSEWRYLKWENAISIIILHMNCTCDIIFGYSYSFVY